MAVPHRRGRVVGLQVELYHAPDQGAGSVSVRDSTVASALGDGDPVVDLWPLFFTR